MNQRAASTYTETRKVVESIETGDSARLDVLQLVQEMATIRSTGR